MTRVYCWLTLCAPLNWVGSRYDPDGRFTRLTAAAQLAWFQLHNNRLYAWLDRGEA